MVRDVEENKLIQQIEDAGHPIIAKHVLAVLNKRDEVYIDIQKQQREINKKIDDLFKSFERHAEDEQRVIDKFMEAFPQGDIRGHLDMHEAWLAREEQRYKFREAVINKSIASLIWLMILGIGVAVFDYIKDHLHF